MNLLTALNAFLLFAAPINTEEVEIEPINFRVQVYPFGGYYSYPPTCPPGYSYGPYGSYGSYGCYPYWRGGYGYYGRYNYGPGIYFRYGRGGRYYNRRYYGRRGRRHHGGRHRGGRGRGGRGRGGRGRRR